MKVWVAIIVWLFVLGALCAAQTDSSDQNQSAAAAARANKQPKIDPAKEAAIRQLFEVGGTKALVMQVMTDMEKGIRPALANSFPPGDYRDKLIDLFFEKFHSKADPETLLSLSIPVYDKYFTTEEIKGLTAFYTTPLGHKTMEALPKVMGECQEAGRKWGEQTGRGSMLEVLAEHPELKTAMEAASKPSN
jgi:Uncharacterized protein conserved in bacteria (DUF2059)